MHAYVSGLARFAPIHGEGSDISRFFGSIVSDERRLQSARKIFEHVAELANARFSIRLWDGSMVPLGRDVDPSCFVSFDGPGVLGSLLRRPTIENLLRQYVTGRIEVHGGDLIAFAETARENRPKIRLRDLKMSLLLHHVIPLWLTPGDGSKVKHRFRRDETESGQARRDNRDFIQFHYDLSNEFYALFLDPEMQYSCAYFTDWGNSLERAQIDKLNMICRKLRLAPGERLLDIGCGWGGLLCYAARNFGVRAHGVTLSQKQHDYAWEKIRELGLEDRVTVELRDYTTLEGTYDKIASIGMYEHVGIANYPTYFRKIRSLLRDRGILLNHGICRRAKSSRRKFGKVRPEKRLILKYIFPGSELDHIGHTVESMETCGFEVHDVENWREHYTLTCKTWCQRLSSHREEAVALVGPQRYRMWLAYLAGVSIGFADGSLRVYQTVATKHKAKGPSGLPPTRRGLYFSEGE